ncbi:MAG: hypothetical protein EPN22_17085 [Nitrospirae bacterium]|nr:MAG: hypothetical protein EPN22_17085 [Nitrospirota bacterium]
MRFIPIKFSPGNLTVYLAGAILTTIFFVTAYAQAKDSCVTDMCHSDMGREKFVHGPVAVGECTVCHKKTGKHKFTIPQSAEALCYKCHPDKVDMEKGAHAKSKEVLCIKCHDPHQSQQKFQLKTGIK